MTTTDTVGAGADPEPSTSEPAVPGDPRRWLILVVLCLALLIVGIDGTIVNVALPTLVREIGASSSDLQWIVDAYTILFASFLLIAGNTGDRLGRKGAFLVGLAIFGGGSLACSLVSSPGPLIAFRAVQGFGAAFVMPATLSILTNVFLDASERARAIALWSGVSGLGVAVGPVAGGYLLEHFWWGSIFLVNVPLVVITIVAAILVVPRSKDPDAPPLDVLGTVLSTTGLVALLYAIIEGPDAGWGSAQIVGCFVAAAVLLAAFVLWERHTAHPILDVTFFANPSFSASSVAVTLVFFAMFGALFFISQYLQFVLGYSALLSGIGLLPVAVTLMAVSPLSAKLAAWIGTKVVVASGLAFVAGGLLLFSATTTSTGYWLVGLVLVLVGVGMGLAMAPATDAIMGSIPKERAGVGSAVNDATREIGGALGVAILGSITAGSYAATIAANPSFAALQQASPEAAEAVRDSVGGAALVAQQVGGQAAGAITDAANAAFVAALDHTVFVGAGVAVLGAVVALIWLPSRPRAAATDLGRIGEVAHDAARDLPAPLETRRALSDATLGLLADAGMSSLTFNGIATRAGYSTATIERVWGSKADAVVDSLQAVLDDHPVPDTGDLRTDLAVYLADQRALLTDPGSRAVLGRLIAETAGDEVLAEELHDRLVSPRQARFRTRLDVAAAAGQLPAGTDTAVLADLLVGPVWFEALVTGEPRDLDTALDLLLPHRDEASTPGATDV